MKTLKRVKLRRVKDDRLIWKFDEQVIYYVKSFKKALVYFHAFVKPTKYVVWKTKIPSKVKTFAK